MATVAHHLVEMFDEEKVGNEIIVINDNVLTQQPPQVKT